MTTRIPDIMLTADARTGKFALRITIPSGTGDARFPVDIIPLDTYDLTQAVFQTDVATSTIDFSFEINGTPVVWDGGDADLQASDTAAIETATSDFTADPNTNKPVEVVIDLDSATNSPVYLFIDLFHRITE